MPADGKPDPFPLSSQQGVTTDSLIGITGATGFVGGRLCYQLTQQGLRLRLLVRSHPQRLPEAIRQQAEIITGDLHDVAALHEFTAGCAAVIHCAASVRGNSWQDFASANVAGTGKLISAMQTHGDAYLLHLSSLAALQPQLSWYSRSKQQAEHVVSSSGLPTLILRPPALYGPGDRELRPLLDMLYRGGIALRVTAAQQRLALLHVDDLCRAISAALATRLQGCYCIDDGNAEGYDWDELRQTMQQLSGRPVRTVQLPATLLHTLAHLNLHWSRLRGKPSMLNPGKARELRWPDWRAPTPRLQDVLDWQPEYPLRVGLRTLY